MLESIWRYLFSVEPLDGLQNAQEVTLTENGPAAIRAPGAPPAVIRQYRAIVRQGKDFDWSISPTDPGSKREELQATTIDRLEARDGWMQRAVSLVNQIEAWAKELDWSTRRFEKKLDDQFIGDHKLPALIMQEETYKFMLEPIGWSGEGAEGVVDLYLMPAYDDVTRFVSEGDKWKVIALDVDGMSAEHEPQLMPLTKQTLTQILSSVKQHAA